MASIIANLSFQNLPPNNSTSNSPVTDSETGKVALNKETSSPFSPSLKDSPLPQGGYKILVRFPIGKSKSAHGKVEPKKKWNLRPKPGELKKTKQEKLAFDKLNSEGEKKDKRKIIPKFSISLTQKEIERDIMAISGSKLVRKPKKKRSMDVQRNLDYVFPGLGLSSITPNSYRVRDRRG